MIEKINVVQLGARMHYAVPSIFRSAGVLGKLFTDAYGGKPPYSWLGSLPPAILPKAIRRLIGRKSASIPNSQVQSYALLGLSYAYERAKAPNEEVAMGIHLRYGDSLCVSAIKEGALNGDAVWGFNSASLPLFVAAKQAGIKTILEQTIAPRCIEQQILDQAARMYPGWTREIISAGPNFQAFVDREKREWEHADQIICGSDFVKQSIANAGGPSEKCTVVPYGVKTGDFRSSNNSEVQHPRLKALFLGAVNLRKGAPIILETAARTKDIADWKIAGPIQIPEDKLHALQKNTRVLGPIPRSDIPDLLSWADVLILPSMCEGSATVIYEALAAGLPVICSINSGSIIEDGVSGLILRENTADELTQSIIRISKDPAFLSRLGAEALLRSKYGDVDEYQKRLLQAVGIKY